MKRIIEYVNAVLLFVIFAVILAAIVCRGILNVSISWPDELSRAVYTVMVFLGAATALRDRSHITVDIVTGQLPPKYKRVFRTAASLAMLPFIGVMVAGAAENVQRYWKSVVSTVGWLKLGHLYLAVAASGVLMLFYIVLNLLDERKAQ
jgi:TRAP-type C4-dicarboxylate transport system permease small subunit